MEKIVVYIFELSKTIMRWACIKYPFSHREPEMNFVFNDHQCKISVGFVCFFVVDEVCGNTLHAQKL